MIGCTRSVPNATQTLGSMQPPKNTPADSSKIHPWVAGLLNADTDAATTAIHDRMTDDTFGPTLLLANWIAGYTPRQIVFNGSVGYVACIKIENDAIVDMIYIPQPLDDPDVRERVAFFDDDVQPLMTAFYKQFAGVGQEMEGVGGQFSLNHFPSAADIANYEPEKLGVWKTSRLFYSAQNGDSVFINKAGATAWHAMETNELVPLFDELAGFTTHFVQFRSAKTDIFDSWSSREFLPKTESR